MVYVDNVLFVEYGLCGLYIVHGSFMERINVLEDIKWRYCWLLHSLACAQLIAFINIINQRSFMRLLRLLKRQCHKHAVCLFTLSRIL